MAISRPFGSYCIDSETHYSSFNNFQTTFTKDNSIQLPYRYLILRLTLVWNGEYVKKLLIEFAFVRSFMKNLVIAILYHFPQSPFWCFSFCTFAKHFGAEYPYCRDMSTQIHSGLSYCKQISIRQGILFSFHILFDASLKHSQFTVIESENPRYDTCMFF